MIIAHEGKRPRVHPSSRVAPTAILCGDVTVGANCSIGFGAVLTAESGAIQIGSNCVIMDTAVIRGIRTNPVTIGNNVLIGPRAYLTGCTVGNDVFLATGTTVFNGAVIKERCEVRINAVVHIKTILEPDTTVPIGWVAVGQPAELLPAGEHERIWELQKPLDFPKFVFGASRPEAGESIMPAVMPKYARSLNSHEGDLILE